MMWRDCDWCGVAISWTGRGRCLDCLRAYARDRYYRVVRTSTWTPQIVVCPVCSSEFTQRRYGQVYCDEQCRMGRHRGKRVTWTPKKLKTAARGYGGEHQKLRRELLPTAIGHRCLICFEVMTADQTLDLDHSVPLAYGLGLPADRITHARCNRSQGQQVRRMAGAR